MNKTRNYCDGYKILRLHINDPNFIVNVQYNGKWAYLLGTDYNMQVLLLEKVLIY